MVEIVLEMKRIPWWRRRKELRRAQQEGEVARIRWTIEAFKRDLTRDPECVARWPECADGEYNPECCRFPKSCSCETRRGDS